MNEPDGPSVWTAYTTSIHMDFTAVGDGIRGFVTRQLLRPARAFPYKEHGSEQICVKKPISKRNSEGRLSKQAARRYVDVASRLLTA